MAGVRAQSGYLFGRLLNYMNNIQQITPKHFREDRGAKTKSYFFRNDRISKFANNVIYSLVKKSIKHNSNSRICLHKNTNSNLHQMIVCQMKSNDHPAKLHIRREKSYQVLVGKLRLTIYDEKRQKKFIFDLSAKDMIPLRVPPGVFHHDRPLTKRCVHLETIGGSFIRKKDRILAPPSLLGK
jgi:cupin fold WbuC family metalloprotein